MTYLFLGRRTRGKTTLAYYMAAKLPRRVLFDPRGMIRRPGAVVVRSIPHFESAMDALSDGDISEVVYSPIEPIKSVAWPAFTREVKNWVIANPHKSIAIMVDELSFVTKPGERQDESFEWVMKTCDSRKVFFFLTCHRPNDVPVDIRAIADYWCIFHATQEHDLDVIRERCTAQTAALVQRLHGSEFVIWDDGAGTMREYRDPTAWYLPLKDGQTIDWESVPAAG